MKKKIISSVLIFVFTWVATGSLDCGCAYANPVDTSALNVSNTSQDTDCHSSKEAQSKKSEETCCSGCRLENKAPVPSNVQLYGPVQNEFSKLSLHVSSSGVLGFISIVPFLQQSPEFQIDHAHSVPFYNTPIYLAVQSFLI